MGGVEDDEPPSKRVKASSRDLRGLSNGEFLKESVSFSLTNLMARPLASLQGDDEIIGSKGIKKVEFVRIIAEALYSLGYRKTGQVLEEESGIPFHSSVVNLLMRQVRDGKWDESVSSLNKIGVADENVIKLASFVILQQKFFELLDREKIMDALRTLRTEIAPLSINDDRVRELAWLILFPQRISGKDAVKLKSRSELLEELQKLLPPTVMIPEGRLLQLVEQALELQQEACLFHNSLIEETSLFTDHQCGRDQIPSQSLQVLYGHGGEVWFLEFSQNGKYLASSSNDHLAIIWEVNVDGAFSLKHTLTGHQKPVSCVSWSPDNSQLLTCGVEECVRRWDACTGECLHVYEKSNLGLISCGWSRDGKSIFSGVTDKSIIMWALNGEEIECWKGQKTLKISDLQLTSDGKMITMCRESVILLLDKESRAEKLIEEDQTIVSFTLSLDSKFLLVTLVNGEIHLWSIQGDTRLVAKYKGHKRSRFIIRACFGGLRQAFIASGSEDSQVYIWHRGSGELIETLAGHSGAVNCISWNPSNPHVLASASDDHTIRIWGLNRVNLRRRDDSIDGFHCNGAIQDEEEEEEEEWKQQQEG